MGTFLSRVINCRVDKKELDETKIMKDTDIKTLYSYCDLSGSSKVKGHGAK